MNQLFLQRLIALVFFFLVSCSDHSDESASAINLLTATPWWHATTIGTPASGYSNISPLVFYRDGQVRIGLNLASWKLSSNGKAVIITYSSSKYQERYAIVNLTEEVFHFLHYGINGTLLAEVKYSHCESVSLNPC